MKLLLPLFLITLSAHGQRGTDSAHAERIINIDSNRYMLRYDYSLRHWFEPAVAVIGEPRDKRHFSARISVYKLEGETKKLLNVINGTYVPAGCFEDIPENWVKKGRMLK